MAMDGKYRMIPREAVEGFLGSHVPFDWLEVYMPTFDAAMGLNLDAGSAVYASIGGNLYRAKQCNKNGLVVLADGTQYDVHGLTRVDVADILKLMPLQDEEPHPWRSRFGVPLERIIVDGTYIGPERRAGELAYLGPERRS